METYEITEKSLKKVRWLLTRANKDINRSYLGQSQQKIREALESLPRVDSFEGMPGLRQLNEMGIGPRWRAEMNDGTVRLYQGGLFMYEIKDGRCKAGPLVLSHEPGLGVYADRMVHIRDFARALQDRGYLG